MITAEMIDYIFNRKRGQEFSSLDCFHQYVQNESQRHSMDIIPCHQSCSLNNVLPNTEEKMDTDDNMEINTLDEIIISDEFGMDLDSTSVFFRNLKRKFDDTEIESKDLKDYLGLKVFSDYNAAEIIDKKAKYN